MISRQVVTIANCIVGVSILAMPFCFKQCGVVLATLLLLLSGIMTRTVCYFLLKASTITRRRTYELLAYHTFGQAGKFVVEISIIGFLVGTLIAFLVVMGDLGPPIMADVFDIQSNPSLRSIIMTALSLFVALPLGLLRNIDSLSGVSTVTMLFYVFLVFKILGEGMGPLWSGSFLNRIDYWRPAGILQCIPIFSMALSCQTQIFGIYDSLPEPSLQKMNEVVKKAIDVCTFFYICVGFFGYIAFCTQNFGGNILLSFGPSWSTQLIKICFILSIAFSFPLVIFPCRASLHSLIFRRQVHLHHQIHDITTNYIPESRLKLLTVGIIIFTLFVSLLIPNIELVLGLVGSTTGSVICIIFPSVMFIRVTSKNTTERLLAQTVFFIGVIIMVVTTYATLYAVEQAQTNDPSSLLVTDNLKVLKIQDEKRDVIDKVIKIEPPLSLDTIDTKSSNFDQLIGKPGVVDEKPEQVVQNPVTKNVTFVKIKEMSNDVKLKFTKQVNNLDHNAVVNKEPEESVKIPDPILVEGGGGGVGQQEHNPELHGVKKLTNNEIGNVPQRQVDRKETEHIKKDNHPIEKHEEVVKNVNQMQVEKEIDHRVESAVVQQENVVGQEDVKQPESAQKIVKKEFDNKVDSVAVHQDSPSQIKKTKIDVKKINLTEHASQGQVADAQRKLNAEDVLKQLEKHEQEHKKLLAAQKEILAKLKQHQADDELKQRVNSVESIPLKNEINQQEMKSQPEMDNVAPVAGIINQQQEENVPKVDNIHNVPHLNDPVHNQINVDKIHKSNHHQQNPVVVGENMDNKIPKLPLNLQAAPLPIVGDRVNYKEQDSGHPVKIPDERPRIIETPNEKPIPHPETIHNNNEKDQNKEEDVKVINNKGRSEGENDIPVANLPINNENIVPHQEAQVIQSVKKDSLKQSEPASQTNVKKIEVVQPLVKKPQVDRDI